MNTKLVMASSAALMAVGGVFLQFFPHEILNYLESPSTGINSLFLQLVGALYLGLAATNWMAKSVLIGGIYARPLAIGNFAHFLIGALALIKYAFAQQPGLSSPVIWVLAIIYSLFAVIFGYVFFTHPLKKNLDDGK
jgi:hypothetical protein